MRSPENMESSNEENFTTKWRKHEPECETPDLQPIKDSGPIGPRKTGWYIDYENGEDEALQIKRRMKSTPLKGNLGIFEKANEEFQVEDYTPELVVLDIEQNKTDHGSLPSPTKQISGSKKSVSEEHSRVSDLDENTEKDIQYTRSPEIQVCTQTQVLKQLEPTKNSNLDVLEGWPQNNDHYSGSPKLHGNRTVLKLHQFVCCKDSQLDENSTQLEAEHSSPANSQVEVDQARKNFQSLMKEFRLNLQTVTQAFLKNSGELEATKYFLKNGVRPDGYPIWTQQDDIQLMNEDDELKINLNKKFGTDNVNKRIVFLKS